jgi:hypothetical protein
MIFLFNHFHYKSMTELLGLPPLLSSFMEEISTSFCTSFAAAASAAAATFRVSSDFGKFRESSGR